jgi:hypothetical protein
MIREFLAALRSLVFGHADARLAKGEATTHRTAERLLAVSDANGEGRDTMNAAYEKLIQHLDEREIKYMTDGDNRSVCADFRGEVGPYRIVAMVDPEIRLFQIFGHSPIRIPVGCRPAIAETVARANYGLRVGKFELNVDEGELRFQACQILTGDDLPEEIIDRLFGTAMSMLNCYLPAVLSVIYGNELPKDAITCVEGRKPGSGEGDRGERGADD